MQTFIGTAGWSIPATHAHAFVTEGAHLSRYAAVMNAVEINSSFHRPHRPKTYERWRATVGADFRFSVKLPKTITHELRLKGCKDLISRFFEESAGLGTGLKVVLAQLPPSLAYDARVANSFFKSSAFSHQGDDCLRTTSCLVVHTPSRRGVGGFESLTGSGGSGKGARRFPSRWLEGITLLEAPWKPKALLLALLAGIPSIPCIRNARWRLVHFRQHHVGGCIGQRAGVKSADVLVRLRVGATIILIFGPGSWIVIQRDIEVGLGEAVGENKVTQSRDPFRQSVLSVLGERCCQCFLAPKLDERLNCRRHIVPHII